MLAPNGPRFRCPRSLFRTLPFLSALEDHDWQRMIARTKDGLCAVVVNERDDRKTAESAKVSWTNGSRTESVTFCFSSSRSGWKMPFAGSKRPPRLGALPQRPSHKSPDYSLFPLHSSSKSAPHVNISTHTRTRLKFNNQNCSYL